VLSSANVSKLQKQGWRIDLQYGVRLVISKLMQGLDQLANPEKRMALAEDHPNPYDLFPAQNDNLIYGYNRFAGKYPFAVKDSTRDLLPQGLQGANRVLLAGSFTNWQYGALPMTRTDSGWIAIVPLGSGKYWYKFIIDGGWDYRQGQ